MKTFIKLALILVVIQSCGKKKGSADGELGETETGKTGGTDGTFTITYVSGPATLRVASAGTDTCGDFVFNLKKKTVNQPDTSMSFTMFASGEDSGALLVNSATTDDSGNATVRYCSGEGETTVTVTAKVNALSANSPAIPVQGLSAYSFSFTGKSSDSTIKLTFKDAGADCTALKFQLKKGENPVQGTVRFKTQPDYPMGVKLAEKVDTGLTAVDATTLKSYAYYDSASNGTGVFTVPICSGTTAGNVVISGAYVDADGNGATVESPIIKIDGGLASYNHLSLTFDTTNAKTMWAPFNNDQNATEYKFTANIGARLNSSLVSTFPLNVMNEAGKIKISNSGIPSDSGKVDFSIMPLNNFAHRPYAVNSTHDVLCNPLTFGVQTPFTDLAKNWRNTVVYYIYGQEQFFDANHNGEYDVGGDGFWDKNQNGVYDAGTDVLTYDAGNDGLVDYTKDWFIDLPTPFVDFNENGVFDDFERLAGDAYVAPNGVWDAKTIVWKSFKAPYYMGVTPYSLVHSQIYSTLNDFTPSAALTAYFAAKGYSSSTADFFGSGHTFAVTNSVDITTRYILAQDICGSPLPGGTDFSVNYVNESNEWGNRGLFARFYFQPGDELLEGNRRLLKEAIGSSTAKLNFDASEHPTSTVSYPVEFYLGVEPCTNKCTGDVAIEGIACGAKSATALFSTNTTLENQNLTISQEIFVPATVPTCQCIAGALPLDKGVCKCPAGETNQNGICAAPPP